MIKLLKYFFFTLFCLSQTFNLLADKGFWYPAFIPDSIQEYIEEEGDITLENIYNADSTKSLNNYVVYLNNGYTASLISKSGLILTPYEAIKPYINSIDSLQEGFLARETYYEKPIFNLTAFFENKPDSVKYDDIRLVYAPSKALAEPNIKSDYSKDRFNANFALLRIYVDRDNNHSKYSNVNQPLTTDSCLTIARHNAGENDFVFYLGYPNISQRNLTSTELYERFQLVDSAKLVGYKFLTDSAIYFAHKEISEIKAKKEYLIYPTLIREKQEKENEFTIWAANHEKFESALRYSNNISFIRIYQSERRKTGFLYNLSQTVFNKSVVLNMGEILVTMTDENMMKMYADLAKLYEIYKPEREKLVLKQMLEFYETHCDSLFLPNVYSDIRENYKGNIDKYLDKLFKKSFVTDEKRFNKYLDNPKEEVFNKDMLIVLARDILKHKALVYNYYHSFDKDMNRALKLYSEGCLALNPEYYHAPEADYTLRMGYGYVSSYISNPCLNIEPIAYLHNIDSHSFLEEALHPMADKNLVSGKLERDTVRTSFLTTCDAPLFRMGEPVFNLKGEIVGMLTSGNKEASLNNYLYHESFRTIATDINYLMYLLDECEADNLLSEIVLGEEEKIFDIEYFTPVDSLLIPSAIDSLAIDSLAVDSLRIDSVNAVAEPVEAPIHTDSLQKLRTSSLILGYARHNLSKLSSALTCTRIPNS